MKKALIAALIVLLFYLQGRLWFGHNSVTEVNSLRGQISELQVEVDAQRETNRRLRSEVDALRDTRSPDAMEEQIRERLGLIGNDESFFLFIRE